MDAVAANHRLFMRVGGTHPDADSARAIRLGAPRPGTERTLRTLRDAFTRPTHRLGAESVAGSNPVAPNRAFRTGLAASDPGTRRRRAW